MTEITTSNTIALPSAISGSAIIHELNQELIPCALYDLSAARAPDSLNNKALREILEGIAYDALQSFWGALPSGV